MRNLNPDQLQAFVSVIEEGGFTSAARVLNLTQPAISLQVRELENRCGVLLIDRDGRKPRLTSAGEDMFRSAKTILTQQEAILGLMRQHRDKAVGRVRIGMGTTTLLHLAGPALRTARATMPTLQLVVRIGTTRELSHAVDVGDLDMALVTLPVAETRLIATPLKEDEIVAIFPASMAEVPAEVTPAWLAGQPFIGEARPSVLSDLTRAWFEAAGTEADIVMRLEHLAAMSGAVSAGLGASIVPRVLVERDSATISVRSLTPKVTRTVALIERPGAASTAISALKSVVVKTITTG
jgi:DNA-binding transcriptional LysR family regulator